MEMKIFYDIIEILHCGFEVLLFFVYYDRIFDRKYRVNYPYAVAFAAAAVFMSIAAFTVESSSIRLGCTFFSLMAIVLPLYRVTAVKAFFAAFLYILLIVITETLYVAAAVALGIGTLEQFIETGIGRVTTMIGTKIVNFWFIIYSCRIYKRKFKDIPAGYIVQIFLVPLLSVIIMLTLFKVTLVSSGNVAVYIIVALALFYINFSVFDHFESYDNRVRLAALERIMEQESSNYKELADSYQEIRNIRHDMANQMSVLNDLIDKGRFDEARGYMREMYKTAENASSVYYTGNSALDSVINLKAGYAKRSGIKFMAKIQSEPVNIDAISLCGILGNALDNAIEACGRIDGGEKYVMLAIKQANGNLLIKIDNSSPPVDINDLSTSKADKKLHGIGMQSIKRSLQKLNGTMTCIYEDGCFSLRMVIPK